MQTDNILEVNHLKISFKTLNGIVPAIRDVSFSLKKGETLAIVGESGSGKSVSTKAITGLLAKNVTNIEDGKILFKGQDLLKASKADLTKIRGSEIAMIFQDPMTSLNPVMTVGMQIAEAVMAHTKVDKATAMHRAIDLMGKVEIKDPETKAYHYPHQFSGGMRQRIMIAMALACKPKILIADEPTTALDVSVQARIIELINQLKDEFDTSVIFITHDLGVVANVADRVAVMYAGRVVETGTTNEIFYHPQHPYTWGLLEATPTLSTEDDNLYTIPGNPPNMANLTAGDPFAPRNPYALDIDFVKDPPLFQVSETHQAATWLLDDRAPKVDLPLDIQARYVVYQNILDRYAAAAKGNQLDTSVGYDLAAFENANAVYGPYLYDELADTTPMYES
ncbi:peptide ABC transporter ATP-binding protein [Aerococcus urinaeequi]|uniref:ABC transporter ATP-binding protein n=1 Tax=Aerococcus urinaeequi TaxID=51665 RepID=UPI0007448659|nr:ABC transporter ATP-binding protein [Aerococcus urinaeequi]ALZ88363.1 peptide ABC transporter ATP-binding protein [Aerococcus urinaeequi]